MKLKELQFLSDLSLKILYWTEIDRPRQINFLCTQWLISKQGTLSVREEKVIKLIPSQIKVKYGDAHCKGFVRSIHELGDTENTKIFFFHGNKTYHFYLLRLNEVFCWGIQRHPSLILPLASSPSQPLSSPLPWVKDGSKTFDINEQGYKSYGSI